MDQNTSKPFKTTENEGTHVHQNQPSMNRVPGCQVTHSRHSRYHPIQTSCHATCRAGGRFSLELWRFYESFQDAEGRWGIRWAPWISKTRGDWKLWPSHVIFMLICDDMLYMIWYDMICHDMIYEFAVGMPNSPFLTSVFVIACWADEHYSKWVDFVQV